MVDYRPGFMQMLSDGSFRLASRAPLEPLPLDWLNGVELAVLRLDRIDPLISGNKWFKLTQHLADAQQAGADGIISLGGAHSNHLHALAAAGKRFDFPPSACCAAILKTRPPSLI